ncbi:site-specific integrase [Specibacter sp. NPDC078692]|uniref:tyrosine-type recombinase/integrase n=1 Tax=Specibacter sp. NPDC078692 TaxID=3155818 RepID=UPI0034125713
MAKTNSKGEGVKPYQIKDGRWRAEITVGWTADGKRNRKTIYAATRAECATKLRAALGAKDTGILVTGKVPTLIEWMEYWLDNVASVKVIPRTLVGYRTYVRKWVADTNVARVRLDKLSAEHIEAIHINARAGGLAETSVTQLHRIVSRALTIAERRGKIGINPARRLDAPVPNEFTPDILTIDDARRLIRAATKDPHGARWIVALSLGLRQGERLGIGWDQIDLNAKDIRVTRELYRLPWEHGCPTVNNKPSCERRAHWCPEKVNGGLFIKLPKSEAGKRHLPLPSPLVDAFTQLKKRQDLERLQAGLGETTWTSANGERVDLVFSQTNGRPTDSRKDWGDWQAFLKSAGVPAVRVHDARHTAATLLLLMGVDGRIVMEMMGWSQSSMLKRYQHVLDEMKRDASNKVTEALWTAPTEDAQVVDLAARRAARARQTR